MILLSLWVISSLLLVELPTERLTRSMHCEQNEEDDDLLERVPTSEIVERLISTYQGSEVAMWASSKVHEASNRVSTSTLFLNKSFVTFFKDNPLSH